MTVSAKTRLVRTILEFFVSALSVVSKEWITKVSASVATSFGLIVLDSRKSKIINLYSDYTENKLQAFTFVAIACVWISLQRCNLA